MTVAHSPSGRLRAAASEKHLDAPRPRSPRLGIDDLYLLVLAAVVLVRGLVTVVVPNDFWFHMATGRVIAETGRVPTHDAFSFTRAGEPFFNQSWLAQLLFFWEYRLGGVELILLVHTLALGAAFAVLIKLCRELGASKRLTAATVGLLALPLAFTNLAVRPQSFAFPLFALALWVVWGSRYRALQGDAAATRRLWALPAITLVWANVHGSFPLALAVVLAALVGDVLARWRGWSSPPLRYDTRLLIIAVVATLTTLGNPAGWRVWRYVVELSRNPVIAQLVPEWGSPALRDIAGATFFLALLAIGVVLVAARRRPDAAEGLLAAGFMLLAASAVRNVAWFGFVAAVLFARLLAGRLPDRGSAAEGNQLVNGGYVTLLVLVVVMASPWVRPHVLADGWDHLLGRHTPVVATARLTALDHPPERLFHELGYGSYLTWARPERRVFVDPRIELYPRHIFMDYIALSNGYDVDRLLARYDIDGVLADTVLQEGLVAELRAHEQWRVAFEDDTTVLFLAAGGEGQR